MDDGHVRTSFLPDAVATSDECAHILAGVLVAPAEAARECVQDHDADTANGLDFGGSADVNYIASATGTFAGAVAQGAVPGQVAACE
jgi:hypothetical protein